MAITAAISLSSAAGDLTSSALSLSTSTALVKAGLSTAITNTSGLARTTTSAAAAGNIQAEILFRGDDATTNGANKVYLKNLSATPAEYFTVHIDQEELGRLYAGDWAFFPWNATAGIKSAFTVTIAATWAAGDTWEFDGVTMTAADADLDNIAGQLDGLNYPNWTTTWVTGEVTVIFTARYASGDAVVYADADAAIDTASNGTAAMSASTIGTASESDITIRPSVHTAMTYETMLIHE